jgi:RimJ/RimL family protein N-acetyltransferase
MTIDPLLIPFETSFAGPRITVRSWREDDAPALHAAVASSREHLRPWMSFADEHQTVEETRAFIVGRQARWLLRRGMNMGIWARARPHLYGGIGVHPLGWEIPAFAIGYWLRADAVGHGYASEAVEVLTGYLLATHGAKRIEIRCDARNAASAAVPRRTGYTLEGVLRQARLALDGSLEDTMVFARIPAENA